MTHAAFPAPAVYSAATAVHERLRAAQDAGSPVNATAMYQARDLARLAAAAGEGTMFVDVADLNLIADDFAAAASPG